MRFGIIGTNFISDWFATSALAVKGAELSAVYSRKLDTGRAFAEKYGIGEVYDDLDAMLSSKSVDAVYIASPTYCHKDHAIAALKHGKAVLCEKMIAASLAEFEEMLEAKARHGGILIEAMRPDFDPAVTVLRDAVLAIGKVRRASFEYCQYSSRYDAFLRGDIQNAFNPDMKNSALADIGIYPLHLCVSLFGEPRELWSKSVFLHNGFEGCGSILMDYGDMLATVTYSKITASVNPSVIEGELGSVTVDKINAPTRVVLHLRGEEPRSLPFPTRAHNMQYEVEEFMRIASGERDSEPLIRLSHAVMRTVDKVYRASNIMQNS